MWINITTLVLVLLAMEILQLSTILALCHWTLKHLGVFSPAYCSWDACCRPKYLILFLLLSNLPHDYHLHHFLSRSISSIFHLLAASSCCDWRQTWASSLSSSSLLNCYLVWCNSSRTYSFTIFFIPSPFFHSLF